MKIAPSLLSADFANLASELKDIEKAGADLVHLDVMDGHFVPNLTFGCPIIKALRKHTTLHAEAAVHHDRLVHAIQEKGMKAGIALNPGTPLSMIEELLPILDFVLIMSVNPGFGGQKFISYSLDKIRRLKDMAKAMHREALDIEVDGGVTPDNILALGEAGVTICVAGSSVFGKPDRKAAIEALKKR